MTLDTGIKAMMEADIEAATTDWSETLTFRGSSVSGTFSPVDTGDDLNEDGLLQTASAVFVCLADDYDAMTDKPGNRDTVSIDGTYYYVTSIVTDPAGVTISVRRN